jgi:hypothetical protein
MSAPTIHSLKAAQHPETCYHVAVVFQMFRALQPESTQQFVPIHCKQFFVFLGRLVMREYGGWSRQRYCLLHRFAYRAHDIGVPTRATVPILGA